MPLEPQTKALLDAMKAAGASLDFGDLPAAEARRRMDQTPVGRGTRGAGRQGRRPHDSGTGRSAWGTHLRA